MNQEQPVTVNDSNRPRPTIKLAGQLPLILALLIIGGLLLAWQPWESSSKTADRTITVTGEAEITAEPDEYIFNPQYESKGTDKQVTLKASTDRTNEIVAKLKSLGVPERKIKTDTAGYRNYYDDSADTYYAFLTIVTDKKDLAQKVQDYLLTTSPSGPVSPQSDFSKDKRRQLASSGRDQATKDARSKAEQSARNLGFKIGKVKSVQDDAGNSREITPYGAKSLAADVGGVDSAKSSAPIQQGENDLNYQVIVTYFVR